MRLPNWLVTLADDHKLMVAAPERSPDLQDTLLIGLGPAGREVLSQIAQTLNGNFGESLPANIRLLQIDVQPDNIFQGPEPPAGLSLGQHLVLRPNYREVERNLREKPEEWEHWGWYKNAAPGYERARSRMALFYDLKDGGENSRLWKGITRAFQGLKNPVVRLVGSTFDDTSSGMLVDMIRICQLASGQLSTDVQLWLMGPQNRDWSGQVREPQRRLSPPEQGTRTLATLRELERFQRNDTHSFQYVPRTSRFSDLCKDYSGAVVQTVFVFQPIKQIYPDDPRYRADLPPEMDALACMADALMALLNPAANQVLNRLLSGQRTQVSAIGCHTVRLPLAQLEEALAWRMVRDSLYELAIGIAPLEQYTGIDAVPGEYQALKDATARLSLAGIDGFDLHHWLKPSNRLNDPAFLVAVGAYVQKLLNGGDEPASSVVQRVGALPRAISQLSLLFLELRKNNAHNAAQRVAELTRALQDWQTWLQGDLRRACQQKFENSQQELAQLKDQPARTWAIDPKTEWQTYRRHLREWLEAPGKHVTSEPLLRMGRHFGWQVTLEDGRLSPRLLVTGREFAWSEKILVSDLAAGFNAERLLMQLYQLAEPLARSALSQATPRELAAAQDLKAWIDRARVRLQHSGVKQLQAGWLLIEPGLELRSDLRERLIQIVKINCDTSPSWDANSFTLMQLVNSVPFENLGIYDSKAWQGRILQPFAYVWLAEQQAARIEAARAEALSGESPQRLSARFTSWLSRDAELLELFGLAVLYEACTTGRGGWQIPGLGKVFAPDLGSLCEILLDPDHQPEALRSDRDVALLPLKQAVAQRQAAERSQKSTYLKRREKEVAVPLENSDQATERDLGAYLRGLIELERNPGNDLPA